MHTPLTLKKVQDKTVMYKSRIEFFKEHKNKSMYKLAVQQYKNWLIYVERAKINDINKSKVQSEYRKYVQIRSDNSIKSLCKDIIGYMSLNALSKILKIKESI